MSPSVSTIKLDWNNAEGKFEEEGATTRSDRFLQLGRVPSGWLHRASKPHGKALAVGLVIWTLAIVTKSNTIMISLEAVKPYGVDAAAKSRALRALAKAGLITVESRKGRFPVVTLVIEDGEG